MMYIVDHEMGSSSTIQLGKPGLGSCEFSEIFTIWLLPKVSKSPVINESHTFAACPRGGLLFVSFANLLAPDGWRRFARQKHYSVGGRDNDQPTLPVSNANAKDGTPNVYRDYAGHDWHIDIEIYWVHSSNHDFHLHLEQRTFNLTNFFWNRLTAPRIMARPNCRLSRFLAKTGRILFHLPGHCQVPLATCWLQHLEGFETSKRWAVGVPITKANGRFGWRWPLTKEPLRWWFRIYPEVTFPNRVGNSTW